MGSLPRAMGLFAPAMLTSLALSACTAPPEAALSMSEAAAAEAFETCSTASITVDRRAPYQASIASFFERARVSGCDYGGVEIADAPRAKDEGRDGALAVAQDFIDVFDLPWRVQPDAEDPSLSRTSVRVTLVAANDADRQIAAARSSGGES